MALVIKQSGSEEFGRYLKVLVCGDPGSGKTLSPSTWPLPLFVNAEGGMLSLRERNVDFFDLKHTNELLELKNTLMQSKEIREKELGKPYETVVIDTFDEVSRMFMKERLESTGKDIFAIQDYGWLGDQLRAVVRNFRNLPMNVILNCHLKSQTDEDTGKMFIKPAIVGAMGDELPGYVDLAVVLTAKPHTEIVNGKNQKSIVRSYQTFPDGRTQWVKDRSGKLPFDFPINFVDDYARLSKLIFGDAPVIASTPQVVATAPALAAALVSTPDVVAAAEEVVAKAPAKKAAAKKAAAKKATPEPASQPEKVDPPNIVEQEPIMDEVPEAPEPEIEPAQPATIIEPEPQPVPEVEPEPEPEAAPEVEAEAALVMPPEEPEEVVPVSGTPEGVDPSMICADCGDVIEKKDQADLARIRFKRPLDRKCFQAARARK